MDRTTHFAANGVRSPFPVDQRHGGQAAGLQFFEQGAEEFVEQIYVSSPVCGDLPPSDGVRHGN